MRRPGASGDRRPTATPAPRWLPWGDGAVLLLFTVLGLRFHKIAPTPYEVLQTAGPLWTAWFLVAGLLGLYRRPGVLPFLAAWILAVPLGLAARQLLLGRPFGPSFLVFLGVALGLTLVFLGVWRIVALGITRLGRPRAPAA